MSAGAYNPYYDSETGVQHLSRLQWGGSGANLGGGQFSFGAGSSEPVVTLDTSVMAVTACTIIWPA